MKRRNWMMIGLALLLIWGVVFFLALFLIDYFNEDIVFEAIPTPTERPMRTDVADIRVGNPTPTRFPNPTPRFTLDPVQLNTDATQQAEGNVNLSKGLYPIRLAIEDLGILAAVVVVQTDDSYNIVVPQDEVGYYALTAKIAAGGNTVMIGHVYPGRVFNKLLDAKLGQIVRITDENYEEHYYQISEIGAFPYESGTEADREIGFKYMYDNSEERLTLVTCYPEYTWTHRFVVRAVPIEPPPEAISQSQP